MSIPFRLRSVLFDLSLVCIQGLLAAQATRPRSMVTLVQAPSLRMPRQPVLQRTTTGERDRAECMHKLKLIFD